VAGLEQELAVQRVELSRREEELMELRDLLQERLTFFLLICDSWVRIRTTDIRIRILLFSSEADKMPTKNKFICLLIFEGTFTLVSRGKTSKGSHKTVEIKVFLTFLLVDGLGFVQLMTNDHSGEHSNQTLNDHSTAIKP
jgi:hypothetical protein